MALVVKMGIMAAGDLAVDVDYTTELYGLLWDAQRKRPHTWFMEVHGPDDALAYPPFVLRRIDGDERGLSIGGPGILWTLGSGGIGPTIEDREYLSGADMLSNGDFHLDDLYWRRPSEGSLWLAAGGKATNVGGRRTDDVFEYALELPPARPGNTYQAIAHGVFASGRVRIRTIFGGRFNPPNLLVNGDMEDGPGVGWSASANIAIVTQQVRNGSYSMRISPIPKPQLADHDFSSEWTLGGTMSVASGALFMTATPKPQYLDLVDADFSVSPYVSWDNSDGTKSFSGTGSYRVFGPIGQHQIIENGSYESGLTNWVQIAGAWATSSATAVDGGNSAQTGGVPPGSAKNLQGDSDSSTALVVDPYLFDVGEEWRFEGYVCSGTVGTSDEADGECNLRMYIVDQAYPLYDSWVDVVQVKGDDTEKANWRYDQKTFSVPPDKVAFVPTITVYGHTAGSWYIDGVKAIRTRGNNTGIYSDDFAALPKQKYRFWAYAISDPRIGGDVTMRMIFKATGLPDIEERGSAQSHTYGKWVVLSVEGTCPDGYDTVTAAIDGDDIVGGSFYIAGDGYVGLEKVDNNTDRSTHSPITIVSSQRYELAATVVPLGVVEGGTVTIGVVLSGGAGDDETKTVEYTFRDNDGLPSRVTVDIPGDSDYTTAAPFVLARDLAGGAGANIVAINNLTLTKVDNNSDSTSGSAVVATPEHTYKWTQRVFFAAAVERGNVRLGVRCLRTGSPDETFYSSPMDKGEAGDTWQTLTFDFTPPSSYDVFIPIVVGTDVEAGYIYLDDGEIRDTDTSTVVFDGITLDPVDVNTFVNATAPAGTESVRVAVVVEAGTTATTVAGVSLVRTDQPPATGDEIVAALLDGTSIGAGDIDCPETIPADWHIANLTNRAALDHYANVVSDPPREYRVTATDPPLLDCKERSALFVDHHPDSDSPVVLVDAHIKDPDVEEMDPPEVDVTDRPSEIKLIGTERALVSGGTTLIAATASVPGGTERDYNNRPMVRTEIVSAGTVDHEGYARALASDLADQAADPPLAVTVTLNEIDDDTADLLGIDARPSYDVGDWIYAVKPTAGLEDPNYSTMVAGSEVFPRRVRVLDRERSHGPGYYVILRRPDGTTIPLPGIIYGPERTSLTVGDRLPEWVADPQGKAEGEQYLSDRASRPR